MYFLHVCNRIIIIARFVNDGDTMASEKLRNADHAYRKSRDWTVINTHSGTGASTGTGFFLSGREYQDVRAGAPWY